MALRLRRGTEAERVSVIFQEGELVYVTDTKELYSGDGVTPGGIKVSNVGSPDALTQNLDLDGFNIFGSGSITATAFIGDGSGLTNVGGGGIVDGSNYRINIAGDDSSIIVNSATNTVTGIFVGDGSGITNILIEQLDDVLVLSPANDEVLTYSNGFWINAPASGGEGVVEGGNYKINILSDNSTTLVNTSTNTLTGNIVTDSIEYSGSLVIDNSVSGSIGQITLGNTGGVQKLVIKRSDTGTTSDQIIGSITVEQVDDGGATVYSTMGFWHSGIYIGHSPTGGSLTGSNYIGIQDGGIALGKFSLESGYKLDVTGDAKFRDTVVIENSSLRFDESRDLIDISPPSLYELTVNISTNKLAFYDGLDWYDIVGTPIDTMVTSFPGPIAIEGITEVDRNDFGQDSVAISGSMIYNTTADRFEFFQAGSWIPLANQELEETSDVQFATVTANSFISTGGGAPTLESETVINLQAGERVRVTTSPFRLAQLTTTERNLISPVAGDLIYNTTDNRFQGYQNGGWINLDDGTAA
jgi:hypothetical protein